MGWLKKFKPVEQSYNVMREDQAILRNLDKEQRAKFHRLYADLDAAMAREDLTAAALIHDELLNLATIAKRG